MELIRKSDALHAVLHNTGDAAVAAVQDIKPINPHGELREWMVDMQIEMDALHAENDRLKSAAVDAVPVVHGEWTNRRTWTHDGEWYCTACDKEITIYMGEKRGNDRYKYCPNCGAKMDGKEKDK